MLRIEKENVEHRKTDPAMKKALSVSNLISKRYKTIPFTGEWFEAFGEPERTGTWLIWGNSGNGKSAFAIQLCAELCKHGRVLYNSLEEGSSLTFRNKIEKERENLNTGRFNVVSDNMKELSERLMRRNSADFVIIDSFQYFISDFQNYMKFKEAHNNKLVVFISHADGKRPSGRSARSVLFDASLKIWIEGFKAFSNGRFIGPNGGTYTIWKEGAWKFWGGGMNRD